MNIHRIRRFSALLVMATMSLVATDRALAQSDGDVVTIGEWREIESKTLGETRRVIISTPKRYDVGDDRYPVLYVLDGRAYLHYNTGIVDFLSQIDDMPAMIVVAVTNTDRQRDYTPPLRVPDPRRPTAGGADNFIRFFADELVPFVDEHYRTQSYRVLVGHSLGGLFALHTLVHRPDLFSAYIAISPSLHWDEQMLVTQAETFFNETTQLNKALYMTVGNEGNAMLGGVLKIAGILAEKSPDGFEWDYRVMKDESHASVPLRSTRQGLEFVFRDWRLRNPMDLYNRGGMEAIHAHYRKSSDKYGIERETPRRAYGQTVSELASAGRLKEARALIEHDPERFPPSASLYMRLGRAHLVRDDREGAIECYTRALQLIPGQPVIEKALTELGVDPASVVTKVNEPTDVPKE